MLKNTITRIARWFANLVGHPPGYKVIRCDELPDVCAEDTLYLIGERNNYWMAALICPCGCGDLIQLALDPTGRPRWQVSFNEQKQVTLKPSVHRNVRCGSHFFFQDGKIIWCQRGVAL